MKLSITVLAGIFTLISSAQIKNENIAILKYNGGDYFWLCKDCQSSNLTEKEYNSIEKTIAKQVVKYNSTTREKIRYENYKRQYVVFLDSKNEKQVWVNFFCKSWEKDWQNEIVRVKDGGKCYFNLIINLENNTVETFSINGEA